MKNRNLLTIVLCSLVLIFICSFTTLGAASGKFYAVGTSEPVVKYLEKPSSAVPRQLRRVAVEVHFDLVPTMMRFSMPCYPCMVTENGIHYSNGWTETYDPKASSSCEVLWDKEARYARMWIESQNPARIVVRWRAALADPDGRIAHIDIPSGSPYGKGDWTDEWYYIYPDGTHTRHVRIYTGLAGQSLTVTDETFGGIQPIREIPPSVVHEFQEDFIFGLRGHTPLDDIELAPITLIMMDGRNKTIPYKPYPKDFGAFLEANIKVANLKSQYRPFTIFMPYGVENEPYPPEGELPSVFQTWPREPKERGYSTSLGHTLNWWHYRRTENILEQVYLSGMTKAKDPAEELLPLAHSWLRPPQLKGNGIKPRYKVQTYDPTQRAYVLSCGEEGPKRFELALAEAAEGDKQVFVENPAFVIKRWGKAGVNLKIDGEPVKQGKNFRVGYEKDDKGTNLVIWVQIQSDKTVRFSISPVNK
ncbi:MAG: hypothetical protein ACYS0I_07330 [Planctomycetota bacterium]|jgi:hypothetical protein